MKYNQYSPSLVDKPIRLLDEEIENPLLVFHEVFEFYDLNHIRVQLGDWLELAFSSEDEDLKDPIPRVNLIQFALHMEATAEAAFLLYQQDRERMKRMPPPVSLEE
ncbi:MAG: hypothetical protein EOO09_19120 [Chitinophagaceae bacterium]|nr:MAG: hypothetical protein EOO09_19120 [Chitinophagaceae bacterium]